jgi:uncharacterized repeat protein (TIGR01451 family)
VTLVKGPAFQTVVHNGVATYVITVRNTGNVVLRDVTVADTLAPDCARRFASLAPGESRTYSCTRSGVTAGSRNVASVTARSPAGSRVRVGSVLGSIVRIVSRPRRQIPAIVVVKSPGRQVVAVGHSARFQIVVRNAGNVTLHGITVTDSRVAGCNRTVATLAAGRSVVYTCRSAPAALSFTNLVTATGVSPTGRSVIARDYGQVVVPGTPPPPAPPPPFGPPAFTG